MVDVIKIAELHNTFVVLHQGSCINKSIDNTSLLCLKSRTCYITPGLQLHTNSLILSICFLLVILSYSWQFLRRIPVFAYSHKKGKEQKFSKKPEFIMTFEKLCKASGISLLKSKTAKELLNELTDRLEEDTTILELVDYYYEIRFAGQARDKEKEKKWDSLLQQKLKRVKAESEQQ